MADAGHTDNHSPNRARATRKFSIEWVGPILLAIFVIILARECIQHARSDDPPFAPVRLVRLEVEPDILVIGQPATLYNGYCNYSDHALNLEIWLGLERPNTDPLFQTTRFNLLDYGDPEWPTGRPDTDAGRQRDSIDPNECVASHPINVPAVPSYIPPGNWQLSVHMVVTGPHGEKQHISEKSNPFDVVSNGGYVGP